MDAGIHALGWTKAELGPKVDIKGIHDLLIASGSQPLSILERRVDDWIAARKQAQAIAAGGGA